MFLQLNKREQAAGWLAKSAAIWQQMHVSGLLEPQRAAQLAAVETDLAKARR